MASIGAYIMQATPYAIRVEQVVTFASPKPGDGTFQTAYQQIFPTQIRYENYGDLVPLLLPADELIRAVADIPLIGDLFRQAETWITNRSARCATSRAQRMATRRSRTIRC
jgi:hypothetical protein